MDSKRIASVDMGTNTFRLLIVESSGDCQRIKPICQERRVVRMGEGLAERGEIPDQAVERGLDALYQFKVALLNWNVQRVIPIATSVFREAVNALSFLVKAREILNTDVRVITGKEEAYLTLLGALKGLPNIESGLLFDIGGGSTELIRFRGRRATKVFSTHLGVVKLTEKYLHHDPPPTNELNLMKREIEDEIKKVKEALQQKEPILLGTAGTVTTLAAIELGLRFYEHQKVHGHLLKREAIENILNMLLKMNKGERLKVPGLEEGREDLIIPGAVITLSTMDAFFQDCVLVSDFGLREGIILDALGCQ